MNQEEKLKLAAISGIILILSGFLISIISTSLNLFLDTKQVISITTLLSAIITLLFYILFYQGFIIISKRYSNNFLSIISKAFIVLVSIYFIITLAVVFFGGIDSYFDTMHNVVEISNSTEFQEFMNNPSLEPPQEYTDAITNFTKIIIGLLVFFLIASIAYGIISVLFGIAILKSQDKLEYAKPIGILNIIAGCTYIILIGYIIKVVSLIIEIILLFNESAKTIKIKKQLLKY